MKIDDELETNIHGTIVGKLNAEELVSEDLKRQIKKVILEDRILSEKNNSVAKKQILQASDRINSSSLAQINKQSDENQFFFSSQELNWLKKNTMDVWGRYLLNRYNFKILPQKGIINDFPPYVLIEPTSVCNIRCIMCFQVDKSFSSNKKHMGFIDIGFFQDLIRQIEENNCNTLTLASRGEPTLHKNFKEIAEAVKKSNILDSKINTNATVLNTEKIEQILDAGFSEVIFSVDAGTKETYEKIRVKGKFDKVVENIKLFNEIRSKNFKNSKTLTRVSGVKVKNYQDIEQMASFWSEIVDEVSIKSAAYRWDTYNNPINDITEPCLNLWNRMYVWFDGKVNPCDTDYKSYLSVGNANDKSLKELWNSEEYIKLRELHVKGNRGKINPCDRCSYTN